MTPNTLYLNVNLVRRIILGFAIFTFASTAIGQKVSAISLFESDSIVHVKLTTDMKLLVKKKYDEEYQPAQIEITSADGAVTSYDVKIKSRGNKRKEACNLPPIKVKFPKKNFTFNKLKWVITCNNSDPYDQILLKEYLLYKIFEQFTDKGFGTELLRVEYVDTGRDGKTFSRYGFVIENAESVAERLGGRVYNPKALNTNVVNKDQMALFTMFQYMIANTDWAYLNLHNLEAVTDPATSSIAVLPYDFDYSGFVNTTYAVVHESLPMESVTERYNKGYCLSEELCEKYRLLFISKQEDILKACREFKYFNKKTRKDAEAYLKGFFDDIESKKSAKRIFCQNCEVEVQ